MGPGNASCLCAEGWTGDGQVCVEINNCQLETRGGCSANADCNHVGPGQVSQSPWWMMLWPVINQGVSVDKLPTAFINPLCFYTLHDASLLWEFFLFSNVFTLCFCVCVPACLRCSTSVRVKKASWEMERSVTASTPAPSTMEAATSWWEHITLTVCLHVSLAYPLIHSWNSAQTSERINHSHKQVFASQTCHFWHMLSKLSLHNKTSEGIDSKEKFEQINICFICFICGVKFHLSFLHLKLSVSNSSLLPGFVRTEWINIELIADNW